MTVKKNMCRSIVNSPRKTTSKLAKVVLQRIDHLHINFCSKVAKMKEYAKYGLKKSLHCIKIENRIQLSIRMLLLTF